jgi:hypothetical protein
MRPAWEHVPETPKITGVNLPKYIFGETGVGCKEHGDPGCLCDVNVTTQVPIRTDIHHPFVEFVMHNQGVEVLDRNNFQAVAMEWLGSWMMMRDIDNDPMNMPRPTAGRGGGLQSLDPACQYTFTLAVRAGVPWSQVKPYLGELTPEVSNSLAGYMRVRRFAARRDPSHKDYRKIGGVL